MSGEQILLTVKALFSSIKLPSLISPPPGLNRALTVHVLLESQCPQVARIQDINLYASTQEKCITNVNMLPCNVLSQMFVTGALGIPGTRRERTNSRDAFVS